MPNLETLIPTNRMHVYKLLQLMRASLLSLALLLYRVDFVAPSAASVECFFTVSRAIARTSLERPIAILVVVLYRVECTIPPSPTNSEVISLILTT